MTIIFENGNWAVRDSQGQWISTAQSFEGLIQNLASMGKRIVIQAIVI